jgi:hypothetical protein
MSYSKKVVYFGTDGPSGYANAAKGYIYDLIQNGHEVFFGTLSGAPVKDDTEFYKFFHKNVKKFPIFSRKEKLEGADVVIHFAPDVWNAVIKSHKDWIGDKKIIGRTVWDFDPVPDKWVKEINDSIVNVVSVPSQWCKSVFINSGVKKEIIVEPHTIPPINYEKYNIVDLLDNARIFSPVPINYQRLAKRVKFLTVSSLVARKNTGFLIEAYLDSFTFDDETLLICKFTDHVNNIAIIEKNIQENILKKIKNKDKDYAYAPIVVISERLSFDKIQSLHDDTDVYVNVSKGEGFNIPCYTSVTKNKDVVSPIHGGLVDYLTNYSKVVEVNYNTTYISSFDKNVDTSMLMWINMNTKSVNISYEDLCNGLKTAYYSNIKKCIHFHSMSDYEPRISQTEESSLFPIHFKHGWHNEMLVNGIWSDKNSEIVIGPDVYKFEVILETIKDINITLSVNDVGHDYKLTRGKHSLKVISKEEKNIKINCHSTFDGSLINRDVNKQYGIKLVDVYVNGIRNPTSRLILKETNFNEQVLVNTGFIVEKSNVLAKGEYGDIIVKFKELTDNNKYPKKINLGRQLSFYSHRSGWNYVLNNMTALNTGSGVYCDGFIESNFSWRKTECILQKTIPYNKSWIGFIHNPPNIPPWFIDNNAFSNIILQDPYFLDSLRKCKGLYTLSEYHAKVIRQYIPFVPVESLYHPTEIPELQFDFDRFVKNPEKKLITIGWWLRKLNALYTVRPEGYQKVRLLPNNKCKDTIFRLEKIESLVNNQHITDEQRNSVRILDFLPNDEYDKILSENLVYLDLYDSSANNCIIECMARATPIFINRLPAVVEYLGEGYPLYIDSQYDLEAKIKDLELIRRAHLYLKTIRYKVEIGHFLESMTSSKIYKSL